jgi:MoaA/NifB/PqqE/SkfB family radical SAM enzyme
MNIPELVARYAKDARIPPFPRTVHIDLINSCNLACPQCWNHSPLLSEKKSPEWKRLKLRYEDFKTIVGQLSQMGVPKLILSGGGEPFRHAKIYKMIGFAKKKKFTVTVLTNGHLIDAEAFLQRPPDRLLINLGAASRETFRNLYPNLDPSRQEELIAKMKRINRVIPITLVMVITSLNYRDIPAYVEMAARFPDAGVSLKPANLGPDLSRLALGREMKQALMNEILPEAEALCRTSGIPHDIPLLRAKLSLDEGEYLTQKTGCYAGLLYSRIYSTGDVFYCCAHLKTGNALSTPFREIWNGPEYGAFRTALFARRFLHQCRMCGKTNLNHSVYESLQKANHG